MDTNPVREVVLEAVEVCLAAQLKAVRALRSGKQAPSRQEQGDPGGGARTKGRSQVEMTYDILKKARQPLHVSEIITRIASRFGVPVDRESLVSALSKRVLRKDRFVRTDKNTFGLLESGSHEEVR